MDVNQNNDDLQNAINNASTNAGGISLGVPPVPPMPAVGAVPGSDATNEPSDFVLPTPTIGAEEEIKPEEAKPEEPKTELPDLAAGAPVVETTPEAESTPTISTEPTVEVEAAAEKPVDSNLEEVKKKMLADLYPLMGKIKVSTDEKYRIYKQMIEATHDKNMITDAYEAAKELADDEARADALLFLLEESDK